VAQDGMTIRLHLKRMKVLRVVEDEIAKLVIEVTGTRSVVRCTACGDRTTKVHETRRVVVRDLPWADRRPSSGCSAVSSVPTAASATPRITPRSRAR
jgi:transposase